MLEILGITALTGAAALAIAAWSQVLRRLAAGRELVAWEPRRPVPWGLTDFGIAFLLLIAFGLMAHLWLVPWPEPGSASVVERFEPEQRATAVLLQMLATAAAASISVLLLTLRYGLTWRDLGGAPARVGSDLRLGCLAFFVLAPPTYLLQLVLVQWVESKHPIMELIADQPDRWLIAISAVSAVVVAPLTEEYLFRGLLQGSLERLADRLDRGVESAESPRRPPWWPIWASAIFFSLMHLSHGPDWIPLLVLSLGLGYLYRQTHRLLPCIVVHFLLNLVSFSLFLVEVSRRAP
jgi:membrane protease YdiL (CAAX protease family)